MFTASNSRNYTKLNAAWNRQNPENHKRMEEGKILLALIFLLPIPFCKFRCPILFKVFEYLLNFDPIVAIWIWLPESLTEVGRMVQSLTSTIKSRGYLSFLPAWSQEAVAIQLEEGRLVKIKEVLKELPPPHYRYVPHGTEISWQLLISNIHSCSARVFYCLQSSYQMSWIVSFNFTSSRKKKTNLKYYTRLSNQGQWKTQRGWCRLCMPKGHGPVPITVS